GCRLFVFFQAEDGIRDKLVTGVQTCALPIYLFAGSGALGLEALSRGASHLTFVERDDAAAHELRARLAEWQAPDAVVVRADALRSEERRVGKGGRPRCGTWG